MKPVRTFTVVPALPEPLERLRAVAYNLRWAWSHQAIGLFRRLDANLWEETGHNPVLMLGTVDQFRLDEVAADPGFLAHLERVSRDLDEYASGDSTWFARTHKSPGPVLAAYFSAEFGVTECLSIFAGGLGLLAGDHLKSASDLGVPLVGVGLLYQEGYFRQHLNDAGWQRELYVDNDFHNLPLDEEPLPDGEPVTVEIPLPGRRAHAQVWRAQIGRVPLYLLDMNLESNAPEDRDITKRLYGGDLEMRIKQEIVLGIGGCRALAAMGATPSVYHMNEGHASFLALERIRSLMQRNGLGFAAAREAASAGLVFTTHTPVAAGHDRFPPDMLLHYLGGYGSEMGLSAHDLLGMGRQNPSDSNEPFCMTVLALRLVSFANGVSRLHGEVSRDMWQGLWPDVVRNEIPIDHVTNGVHIKSWISKEMDDLYDRYLGPRWREEPADRSVWEQVRSIPADELWRTHERRRQRLVAFARQNLRRQLEHDGASRRRLEEAEEALSPVALTIGFARRFATYKRATLLLRDPDRLARILGDANRPVQILFAGKAHPHDDQGKDMIKQIVALSRDPRFKGKLVFLEDYDTAVARSLVQGADVWLNTPRRPMEASGTSGMKAAANGVLNLSILDGWWEEAWEDSGAAPIGWAIGRGEPDNASDDLDAEEADALYDLLEQEVVPIFYQRNGDNLPREWVARMKECVATLCCQFNTHRMVREYVDRGYVPAATRYECLTAEGMAGAKALADWRARVQTEWPNVRVAMVSGDANSTPKVGQTMRVQAAVRMGSLAPDDLMVEAYIGKLGAADEFTEGEAVAMDLVGPDDEGGFIYEASAVPCKRSGLHGLTVRAMPRHVDLPTRFLPGLITWSTSEVAASKAWMLQAAA
jgi:glycogen phosphorylase